MNFMAKPIGFGNLIKVSTRGVHGPKFPGPARPARIMARPGPGPLITVNCKAWPVQAR